MENETFFVNIVIDGAESLLVEVKNGINLSDFLDLVTNETNEVLDKEKVVVYNNIGSVIKEHIFSRVLTQFKHSSEFLINISTIARPERSHDGR
jgi:hypothetical protein